MKHIKQSITGLRTGIRDFDYKMGGLKPGELIILASRPSMGKTALALNITKYLLTHKKAVAFFSLEMSREQLLDKMTKIDGATIRDTYLVVDDTPGLSVTELYRTCIEIKKEHKPDIIIIDYLQLLGGHLRKAYDSRLQEIADITQELKRIALELKVPILVISALGRVPGKREGRPTLCNLQISGASEEDADIVLFLYREDYYKRDTLFKNIAEIIIAKANGRKTGVIQLRWIPEYGRFEDMDSHL